ncbi:hypothetical protein [Pandoravirus japonicus]|uniref:Uncharacterized protein n=1 Tax=Pandoravirus japonicus TaxID=2823154 RepID=A0A811BRE3_9VIRU|nr:hypothetical protein [Pandoravirus japonicus]
MVHLCNQSRIHGSRRSLPFWSFVGLSSFFSLLLVSLRGASSRVRRRRCLLAVVLFFLHSPLARRGAEPSSLRPKEVARSSVQPMAFFMLFWVGE